MTECARRSLYITLPSPRTRALWNASRVRSREKSLHFEFVPSTTTFPSPDELQPAQMMHRQGYATASHYNVVLDDSNVICHAPYICITVCYCVLAHYPKRSGYILQVRSPASHTPVRMVNFRDPDVQRSDFCTYVLLRLFWSFVNIFSKGLL